jgi:hypothetical protein
MGDSWIAGPTTCYYLQRFLQRIIQQLRANQRFFKTQQASSLWFEGWWNPAVDVFLVAENMGFFKPYLWISFGRPGFFKAQCTPPPDPLPLPRPDSAWSGWTSPPIRPFSSSTVASTLGDPNCTSLWYRFWGPRSRCSTPKTYQRIWEGASASGSFGTFWTSSYIFWNLQLFFI